MLETTNRAAIVGALALAGLLLLGGASRADRLPCGSLLLPYFEVLLPEDPGPGVYEMRVTAFAVGNSSEDPIGVTISVWSNWGIPILTTEVDIGAKAMFTANLRDWLIFGHLPDRDLTPAEIAHVQAALAGLPSPQNGLYYATPVADRTLAGYVTASANGIGSHCETLWGDFFSIDPLGNAAQGESLVRMVAGPSREICERHMVRFLQGGAFDSGTQFIVWTALGGAPSATPEPKFALRHATCQVYDEAGIELGQQELDLLATQALPVADFLWPEPFGWVDCDVGAASFFCQCHDAAARYSVQLRGFCLAEPAGPPPVPPGRVRIDIQKATDGQDADFPPGPAVEPGDEVIWTYEVTNTGGVPLLDVQVVDDEEGPITCPETALDPGESMVCVLTGTAPTEAAWPYLYDNVATVTAQTEAGAPVEDTDPSHYVVQGPIITENPRIDLEKATNGVDADDPTGPILQIDDAVVWTYALTNMGDVPLTMVGVSDDHLGDVLCPATTLAVGESMICTMEGVAVAGQYANEATASGTSPAGAVVMDTDWSHYYCEEPHGYQGCSPGFWKNHPDAWTATGYSTSQSVGSVFAASAAYPAIAAASLIEALDFPGGEGAEGAARVLLRAGVAGLLDAAHPEVDYPWTEAELISQIDAALASGDRSQMLALAGTLDAANNLGCPLP